MVNLNSFTVPSIFLRLQEPPWLLSKLLVPGLNLADT